MKNVFIGRTIILLLVVVGGNTSAKPQIATFDPFAMAIGKSTKGGPYQGEQAQKASMIALFGAMSPQQKNCYNLYSSCCNECQKNIFEITPTENVAGIQMYKHVLKTTNPNHAANNGCLNKCSELFNVPGTNCLAPNGMQYDGAAAAEPQSGPDDKMPDYEACLNARNECERGNEGFQLAVCLDQYLACIK